MINGLALDMHHVGCLVDEFEPTLEVYRGTTIEVDHPRIVRIKSQRVEVCFLPTGHGAFIELVKPDTDNQFLRGLLKKGDFF